MTEASKKQIEELLEKGLDLENIKIIDSNFQEDYFNTDGMLIRPYEPNIDYQVAIEDYREE